MMSVSDQLCVSDAVSYLDIPLLDAAGNPEVTSPVVLVDGFVPPWLSWDCPSGDCVPVEVEDTPLDLLHLVSVMVVMKIILLSKTTFDMKVTYNVLFN